MSTLADVLRVADAHWGTKGGYRTLTIGARLCASLCGLERDPTSLGSPDAVQVLAGLAARGLSPKSVGVYYGAFRRALALSDVRTVGWPNAPTPPRRTRDPLEGDAADRLEAWLRERWPATADLLVFIRGTGLRVSVEALTGAHLTHAEGADYDLLHVVGKGGHERKLPVVRSDTLALLRDAGRMSAMRAVRYRAHLWRWNQGVAACGITSRLATPHAIRHGYASEVYRRSGGNLVLTQDMLGHADPKTTARYISVDMDQKAGALSAS